MLSAKSSYCKNFFFFLFLIVTAFSYGQNKVSYNEVLDLDAFKDLNGGAILTYRINIVGDYLYFWNYKTSTNKRGIFGKSGYYSYGGYEVGSSVGQYCMKGSGGNDFFGVKTSWQCGRNSGCSESTYLANTGYGNTVLSNLNFLNPRNFATAPSNRMFFAYNINVGVNTIVFSTNGGASFNADTALRRMSILQFHPLYDSVLYGRDINNNLIVSNDTGKTSTILDTSLNWLNTTRIMFDKGLVAYYTVAKSKALDSLAFYRSFTLKNWEFVSFMKANTRITPGYNPGELYLLDSGVVYRSTNFGSTFQQLGNFPTGVKDIASAFGVDSLFLIRDTVLYAYSTNGLIRLFATTAIEKEEQEVKSDKTVLAQNYPNPANTETTIKYELVNSSRVTLKVYNILGEVVTTFAENVEQERGVYSVKLDVTKLPAGVYFYTLSTADKKESKKMLIVK